jgi:hypothetical protein
MLPSMRDAGSVIDDYRASSNLLEALSDPTATRPGRGGRRSSGAEAHTPPELADLLETVAALADPFADAAPHERFYGQLPDELIDEVADAHTPAGGTLAEGLLGTIAHLRSGAALSSVDGQVLATMRDSATRAARRSRRRLQPVR